MSAPVCGTCGRPARWACQFAGLEMAVALFGATVSVSPGEWYACSECKWLQVQRSADLTDRMVEHAIEVEPSLAANAGALREEMTLLRLRLLDGLDGEESWAGLPDAPVRGAI